MRFRRSLSWPQILQCHRRPIFNRHFTHGVTIMVSCDRSEASAALAGALKPIDSQGKVGGTTCALSTGGSKPICRRTIHFGALFHCGHSCEYSIHRHCALAVNSCYGGRAGLATAWALGSTHHPLRLHGREEPAAVRAPQQLPHLQRNLYSGGGATVYNCLRCIIRNTRCTPTHKVQYSGAAELSR